MSGSVYPLDLCIHFNYVYILSILFCKGEVLATSSLYEILFSICSVFIMFITTDLKCVSAIWFYVCLDLYRHFNTSVHIGSAYPLERVKCWQPLPFHSALYIMCLDICVTSHIYTGPCHLLKKYFDHVLLNFYKTRVVNYFLTVS